MRRLVLAAALLVAACGAQSGPLKVDGSSKEAADKSIAAMTEALPAEEQAEFKAATAIVRKIKELDGKTADEIVAMARQRKIDAAQKKVDELKATLPTKEAAIDKAKKGGAASKRFLQAISLVNPQLVWRAPANGGAPAPLLTFNMKNGSSEAIQAIVFHATIGPKGGGKPWIDQRFTFKFAEAVTTDESKFVFVTPDLTLPANSDAGQAQGVSPNDYKYDIDFIRVDDLNGRAIMDDEAAAKAEAEFQAAKDAVAAAEAEVKRLQDGGSIAA